MRRYRQRGYLLMVTALAIIAVLGMTGLAIDLGRMYVARNEAQAYVDAAALRAALELDGTVAGLQRATAVVGASSNRWNFGFGTFTGTQVEFAQAQAGPWDNNPASAVGHRFVRVTAGAPVPMSFIRVLGQSPNKAVAARAVAGQMPVTSLEAGLFPFSPFAHDPFNGPDFGLIPGQLYTMRWAASPKVHVSHSVCPGDASQAMINLAEAGGGSERGFIEDTSASGIRKSVVYDYQSIIREIGDSLVMTGGAKQTIRDAIVERVNQDSDKNAETYAEYAVTGAGNGRRIVVMPINAGAPGGYQILQFAAFFLRPAHYYLAAQGGDRPFCGEYIGAYVQGSTNNGGGVPGYYRVRLVL